MLRDTDYMKIAEEYSTSIGVAMGISYMDKIDVLKRRGNGGDDYLINQIVAESIDEGIYKEVIRKVYELQKGRRGKVKDSTIYKRAYKLCK